MIVRRKKRAIASIKDMATAPPGEPGGAFQLADNWVSYNAAPIGHHRRGGLDRCNDSPRIIIHGPVIFIIQIGNPAFVARQLGLRIRQADPGDIDRPLGVRLGGRPDRWRRRGRGGQNAHGDRPRRRSHIGRHGGARYFRSPGPRSPGRRVARAAVPAPLPPPTTIPN